MCVPGVKNLSATPGTKAGGLRPEGQEYLLNIVRTVGNLKNQVSSQNQTHKIKRLELA
jgi:hypothetical protein